MGSQYTDAQKKATIKSLEKNTSRITLRLQKDDMERYKRYAASKGMAITRLIITLIEADMQKSAPEE